MRNAGIQEGVGQLYGLFLPSWVPYCHSVIGSNLSEMT
jgi:hypothetical protein